MKPVGQVGRFGPEIAVPLVPLVAAEAEPRPIQVHRDFGDVAPEAHDDDQEAPHLSHIVSAIV